MEVRQLPWWGRSPVWWCAFSLTVLAFTASIVFSLTSGSAAIAYVIASGIWAPLGLILWRRRPEHPMGPLIALVGFLSLAVVPGFLMGAVLEQFEATVTPRAWPMVLSLAFSGAYTYLFVLAIFLFPDGRPTSRFQRLLMIVLLAAAAVATVTGFLAEPTESVRHPFMDEVTATTMRSVYDALVFSFGFALLVVVISKVVEYRWSQSVRHQQLKWLIYVLVVYLAFTAISFGIIGMEGFDLPGLILDALFTGLIPLAMTVAILKYKLYEIDRLVSRTVTYVLVAVVVAAIFAIPVILIPSMMGQSSDVVIAGATLLAAAAFAPLRNRIQARVDRRFNRARYDAAREIDQLARRLNEVPDAEAPIEETIDLVSRTLQPATIGFWAKG